MTDVGELVVKVRADTSDLKTAMKDGEGQVTQSAAVMEKAFDGVKEAMQELVPVISAAAFVEFSKGAIEAADNLYIMSQRTGIAASTLSALNIPLKQNGSSVDEFSSSMKFLSRNIEQASEGNATLLKRFTDLGLSVTALKALTPEQQFYAVAAALAQVTDQSKFADDGLTLMGRGAAGLFPLIRETGGELENFVQKEKDLGNALGDDEIKKIHEYEDAWISFIEHAKIGVVDLITEMGKLHEAVKDSILGDEQQGPPSDSEEAKFSIAANKFKSVLKGPAKDTSAKGTNNDIRAATGGNASEPAPNPDQDDSKLQQYITNLKNEADAIKLSSAALAEQKAIIEATKKAQDDYNDGLRDTPLLSDEEVKSIKQATDALNDFKKQQDEANKLATKMKEQFASSLADIAINFKGLGDTVTKVIQDIAKEIIQAKITNPLSSSLINLFNGGGNAGTSSSNTGLLGEIGSFISGMFKAGGGGVNAGQSYVVGEQGPEVFVPNTHGTIIPNGAGGGNQVTVVQQFNMSPGLAGTVEAEVRRAAPFIAAQAHSMVFDSIARGGKESILVGKRH